MVKVNKILFEQLLIPASIIAIAALMRLIPHPANVAPIAAMALFGGIYVNKKYALVIPLIALFLSDTVIGFYNGMPFIYGSFLLIGLIGLFVKQHISAKAIILATFSSSLLFFIITNFGVWLLGTIYPKTISGLLMCYTAAIPFFRNTLVGDFIYMGILLGGYYTVRSVTYQFLPQKAN